MSKIDTSFTKEITCPYCGYEHGDSYEISDDIGDKQCLNCDKTFSYERHVEVTYSTEKAPCKTHKFKLDKDYPYHIKKRDFARGEWIELPENEWKYFKVLICKECDTKKFEELTKEEYEVK